MTTTVTARDYNISSISDSIHIPQTEINQIQRDFNAFIKQSPIVNHKNCMICNTAFGTKGSSSSVCLSHSIPQHSLKTISANGELYNTNKIVHFSIRKEEQGTKISGTFRLICRDCDSRVFREYEQFDNYTSDFTDNCYSTCVQQILNEITLKNYLSAIYNNESSSAPIRFLLQNTNSYNINYDSARYLKSWLSSSTNDLHDFNNRFLEAKRSLNKMMIDNYSIIYYKLLDKKLPIAMQGVFTPEKAFDGKYINNYHIENASKQDAHICILPSNDFSIVLLFTKKKYGNVKHAFKTIRNLPDDEAIKAIIALGLLYLDNVYLSPEIPKNITQDSYLRELTGETLTTLYSVSSDSPIPDNIKDIPEAKILNSAKANRNLISRYTEIPDQLIESI
ncbi:hypothetical protein BTHE_1096 [Bifidobacterium thermophilum]|nr:hypothetical protein BTHE_1096 [Bifidobacterium thermophilum]